MQHGTPADPGHRRERSFTAAFCKSPQAVAIFLTADRRYCEVNPAFEAMFGLPRQQIIGRTVDELSFWTDPKRLVSRMADLQIEERDDEFTTEFRRANSETRSARVSLTRTLIGQEDCILAFCWDVTDERRTIRDLNRLFDQSPDMLGIAGFDGRFRRLNPAFETVSGYSISELLSLPFITLVHPDDRESTVQELARVACGDSTTDFENRCRRKDGVYRSIVWSATPDAEQAVFYLMGRDVTIRKRAEEQHHQMQKMDAIGRLASGAAHDFNNLLTIIQGHTEIAMTSAALVGASGKELAAILDAARRASSLTRQLLALGHREPVEPTPLDLNHLVRDWTDLLTRMVGKTVELMISLSPSSAAIHADRGQMEQVLLNLVTNARDAMPEGGRVLIETRTTSVAADAIESYSDLTPGDYIELRVADNGPGMTEAIRTQIFEPFFSTKRPGQGSGLGLAVVFGIVKQSHGTILVESEPGRGTLFRVLLPALGDVAEDQEHSGR